MKMKAVNAMMNRFTAFLFMFVVRRCDVSTTLSIYFNLFRTKLSVLYKNMENFPNLASLKAHVGQEIGTTPYMTVTQEMINDFAKATQDFQWIHVNIEMAKQFSPFKTPVAHGFLTLSLAPKFMADLFKVESVKMGVNYGANKIRFTSAVPSGSQVRMRASLIEVEDAKPSGLKITMNCIFEIEGQEKPACVAELISMLYE